MPNNLSSIPITYKVDSALSSLTYYPSVSEQGALSQGSQWSEGVRSKHQTFDNHVLIKLVVLLECWLVRASLSRPWKPVSRCHSHCCELSVRGFSKLSKQTKSTPTYFNSNDFTATRGSHLLHFLTSSLEMGETLNVAAWKDLGNLEFIS